MVSAVCSFDSVRSAVDCVTQIMQCGIQMSRIEFLDDRAIDASNKYSNLDYKVSPTLFLEFQGTENSVEADIEAVEDIVKYNDGSDFKYTDTMEETNKLWKARHDAWYALVALRPGGEGYSTDVCVPISHLPDMITSAKEDLEASNLLYSIIGHVGDGNFHCCVCTFSEDEMKWLDSFNDRLIRRALAANGTCTGEHGVGLGKRKYLMEEFDKNAVMLMAKLKKSLDPYNLMNPGKVLMPEYLEGLDERQV